MNIFQIDNYKRLWAGILVVIFSSLAVGCASKYGSYKRDVRIQNAFESGQVPAEFKYFYYGYETLPFVIFGIESKYEMNSEMWREISSDTPLFKKLAPRIWEDYGYYKFGADILDPNGNKVGILYTAIRETTIKFGDNNQIIIIPHTPFLWGPGDYTP